MVSRTIILSLILASGHGAADAADSSSSLPRNLWHQAAETASASSEDVPDIEDTRSLQEDSSEDIPNVEDTRSLQDERSEDVPDAADTIDAEDEDVTVAVATDSTDMVVVVEEKPETVTIPSGCLNLLAASANRNRQLKKANYFVFTDGMSNGYYTFNNVTSYGDLPLPNKFGFVTLSCQCHQMGGRDNCCQGDRAKLDVTGIDVPESLSTPMQHYINDICSVTADAIGDNVMPPSGELPTTVRPTTSVPPTSSPSVSIWPSDSPTNYPTRSPIVGTRESTPPTPIEPNVPEIGGPVSGKSNAPTPTEPNVPEIGGPVSGKPDGSRSGDGLNGGAWAGIAIAGAFILTLMLYVMTERKPDEERQLALAEEEDLDHMSRTDGGKELVSRELLAITTNGEMELASDRPPRVESPDATNSLTSSDVSSIPSEGNSDARSAYYASNALLPRPDEESVLSSSDGPSFFNDFIEEGVEVTGPNNLSHSTILNASGRTESSTDSLDQAIESGNWEAVAASAAAFVKRDDGTSPLGGSMSV